MPSTAAPHGESAGRSTADGPLPFVFEVIAAIVVALGGLVFALAGSVLLFGIDRATLADAIDAEVSVVTLESVTLTQSQSVDLLSTVLAWTGTGLIVTGGGMVGFAAVYLALRARTRRASDGAGGASERTALAVVGSAAATLLSFLPGSAGFGGLVAGYFASGDDSGTAFVGALSGGFLSIPAVVIAVFAVGGLLSELLRLGLTDAAALVAVITTVIVAVAVAINVGLGALGGYVGGLFGSN